MKVIKHLRISALVASLVLALIVFLPATGARSQALTSPLGCWSYWWAKVCYQIVGTGLYVNYFGMSIMNETWPGTLYVEDRVVGPNGFAVPWVLYGVNLQNKSTRIISEYGNMPGGSYCAQFEIYAKPVASHCYTVHS